MIEDNRRISRGAQRLVQSKPQPVDDFICSDDARPFAKEARRKIEVKYIL